MRQRHPHQPAPQLPRAQPLRSSARAARDDAPPPSGHAEHRHTRARAAPFTSCRNQEDGGRLSVVPRPSGHQAPSVASLAPVARLACRQAGKVARSLLQLFPLQLQVNTNAALYDSFPEGTACTWIALLSGVERRHDPPCRVNALHKRTSTRSELAYPHRTWRPWLAATAALRPRHCSRRRARETRPPSAPCCLQAARSGATPGATPSCRA